MADEPVVSHLGSALASQDAREPASLRDWMQKDPGDHNYFVVVPFTTAQGALWGAGHIETMFECEVISVAAVDLDTLLVAHLAEGEGAS